MAIDNIPQLKEKRANLWYNAKAFLDSKKTPDGMISNEDAAVYDRMEAEIIALGDQIDRLERQKGLEQKLTANTTKPLLIQPGSLTSPRGSDEYSHAFWNAIRGRGVSNVLSIGTDTSGGYLVPEDFANELVQALQEQNIFRRIARIVSTSREKLKVPVAATLGEAKWIDENETIPESDVTFSQIVLNAYKLGTSMRASTELLEDSAFNMETFIAAEFARRMGTREEEAFCLGDGDGKPTGIFLATGGAPVGVTTAGTDDITFDDVIDLYYSLKPPYRNRAVFVTNDSTMKVMRKIKGLDGQYIWQPSVKEGTPDTIIGRPVYTSPYCPEMAAEALVMAFGDFSYYWIADRREMRFKVLNEKYAENDQVGFFATERIDGKLVLPEAVKLMKMGE